MSRPRLAKGDTIDGFMVGDLVHKGGMALLYETAHPDRPGEPMLMKVPRLFEGEDPAAIVSFEMEQMILPRLSGPHVPRFVAAAGFERQPYLVMERVPGPSLLPRLQELPLPAAEVAATGARIAAALDALHRQHVVHLDVKPSNILHRPTGEAVLVDFGLSHHAQLPDLMEEEFRLPYGTAPYMAPEQVMGVRTEPRSDLFALGALLYFFTTGTRPFGDPQRMSGLKRRLWRDPQPPRRLRPDCPPWLQEVILRCLEVDPERRHPTAAQLAFDLRHPDAVALTPRAAKERRDGFGEVLRRRFNPEAQPRFRRRDPAAQVDAAPIVAVAVDLTEQPPALAEAMRATVRRLLPTLPGARVACLNVLRTNRVMLDTTLDAEGRNKHAQRLAELRHWAEPMRLPEGRATFHVLEAVSPAAALLEYATVNPVDHMVLGARCRSVRRKLLGSVSGEVAAQAPCTVTVVRPRQVEEDAAA
ncbi:bifunctional serine/threonine-protein kinase/universal stress protein [Craurococcus roseus]|uniref:Bifunctional serine/threonine-protein kinase/universal stress protein n=1 Tax=Craurococcus roseus TaxID=77585 RepID=A0ABN1F5Q0_9PROT